MKQKLTRNVVLVWSIAALCAALTGCSSSGDGDSGALERQLDMAQAALTAAEDAQMTAEGERDAALDAQAMAEQAAIDTRVNLAAADKIRDAAAYGVEKLNRVGDTTVITKRGSWDDTDNLLGWRNQFQANNSGSSYTAMSQSYRDGSNGWAMVWYEEDGNPTLNFGAGLAHRPLQTDPELWTWRAGNTSLDDVPGVETVFGQIDDHGLGSAWQGFEVSKTYEEGGTLTMRAFSDAASSGRPSNPYTTYAGADAEYPDIELEVHSASDIPTGWEGHWIFAGGDGLRGTMDGVPGTFSCAEGDRFYCGLEVGRYHLAPGYTADMAADPVIFTPDDGSGDVTLPHPEPVEVPTVNYLSFGNWLFVPEDVTDLDAYDFGVFASGDDPFMVDNLQGLSGTADYAGEASGTYADAPEATISPFNAKVELTADFGTDQDFGTIEGRVYEFEIDGGATSSLRELGLYVATWREGGTTNIFQSWEGGPPFPGGWIDGNSYAETDGARWVGSWGGKFFGNGSAETDHPAAFGGTFGATDGDHTFAGSFGARQQ